MFALKLLAPTPEQDFAKLVGIGVVCAFYGMFFAIPLRKFFILRQRLVFPDATCNAVAIRTLHNPDKSARPQLYCLGLVFLAAFVWTIIRSYAPGILQYWSFFYWISTRAGPKILAAHFWGWGTIETSPVFCGLGMLVTLNSCISFLGGAILAWGIIGPITVSTGLTAGIESSPGVWNYGSAKAGTPRYWLLWPGVMIMLCGAIFEMVVNYKPIWEGLKAASLQIYNKIRRRPTETEANMDDPARPEDQVPLWV
jgi:uncharacterized oligopeptide transporter (OPT) family protein